MTDIFRISYLFIVDVFDGDKADSHRREVHSLKRVHHDDTILRTLIFFVQTAQATLKYANIHFFRKTQLSVTKYIMLQILAFNGGTMKPSEIADWTSKERHNVTTLTRRLERDDLVRVKRNERDKRFVDISLTDKGRQALAQTIPVAQEIVNHVMLSISESDAVYLEKMLEVMRRNVHDGLEGFTK